MPKLVRKELAQPPKSPPQERPPLLRPDGRPWFEEPLPPHTLEEAVPPYADLWEERLEASAPSVLRALARNGQLEKQRESRQKRCEEAHLVLARQHYKNLLDQGATKEQAISTATSRAKEEVLASVL